MAKKKIRYVKVRVLNPGFDPRDADPSPRQANPREDVSNFPGLPGRYRGRYFDGNRGQMIDFGYEERVLGDGGREAYRLPDGNWLSGVRRGEHANLLQRKTTARPPKWVTRSSNPGVTHVAVDFDDDETIIGTLSEFYESNAHDAELVEAVAALQPGESITVGGGAQPLVKVTALSGPNKPASCCSACSIGRVCASDNPAPAPPRRHTVLANRIARGGR